ncbi:MAG: hypothetical protein OXP71_06980 [Candidatus Poribacteria bacterium]|nr:hypothetical protein [Candidatus Poribacteria bacterium]
MKGIKQSFNPETWIPYQLVEPGDFKLASYDSNEIRTFYFGKARGDAQVGLHRNP